MPATDEVDLTAAVTWAAATIGSVAEVRDLSGGWTSRMLSLTPESGDGTALRLVTREPWRTHGPALTTRESVIQQMLASTAVPAPRSRALDAEGETCGHPAHLMSLLPGRVDVDRVDAVSLEHLARLLATIHEVVPTVAIRAYQPWAWEEKFTVPPWATDAGGWEAAFDLLRCEPGREGFVTAESELQRLEERLDVVLRRIDG